MSRPRIRPVLALLAAVAALAAGCGGTAGQQAPDSPEEVAALLAELTAGAPELPPVGEAAGATGTDADPASIEWAGGGLVTPDALERALEEALGIDLVRSDSGSDALVQLSNLDTMSEDGMLVQAHVLTFETADSADYGAADTPGEATIVHRNVIVLYTSFDGRDRSAEVEAAVRAL